MTLDDVTRSAIDPALRLLPAQMDSAQARVALLAFGLQESGFKFRFQKVAGRPYVKGPAMGFWQMERGGGVLGVLTHKATAQFAKELCFASTVQADSTAVWAAIENDDVLAAGFARLLLWSDPLRLPAVGDERACWDLYLRTWRPGKPRPDDWPGNYHLALEHLAPWKTA